MMIIPDAIREEFIAVHSKLIFDRLKTITGERDANLEEMPDTVKEMIKKLAENFQSAIESELGDYLDVGMLVVESLFHSWKGKNDKRRVDV